MLLMSCSVSDKDWTEVKEKLTAIRKKDEYYRVMMDSIARIEGWKSKSIEPLWEKQRLLDSANMLEVDKIIEQVGYPLREKVGELSEIPFLVLQHGGDSVMAAYYHIIVGAGKNGDLRMKDVAQFQDRILVRMQQPQEYGTQVSLEFKEDPDTGQRYDSLFLWTVRDRSNVNERRSAVGLDSLEHQLRRYGIDPTLGYLLRKTATK